MCGFVGAEVSRCGTSISTSPGARPRWPPSCRPCFPNELGWLLPPTTTLHKFNYVRVAGLDGGTVCQAVELSISGNGKYRMFFLAGPSVRAALHGAVSFYWWSGSFCDCSWPCFYILEAAAVENEKGGLPGRRCCSYAGNGSLL